MSFKLVREFVGNVDDFGKWIRRNRPTMFKPAVLAKNLTWSESRKLYEGISDLYMLKFEHYRIIIVNENDYQDLPEDLISDDIICTILNNY